MSQVTYPIHERFATFQGEGVHMGLPAFFIRLFGCPVQCPWCDSAGTWHPDYIPKDIKRMTSHEIVAEVKAEYMHLVVITGGEPAVYDLQDLISLLHLDNHAVHLETSGAFPIKGMPDWITLSPKKWKPPLEENVKRADEFKIIVEKPDDIGLYYRMLAELGLDLGSTKHQIWLHPEWSHHKDPVVLEAIIKTVKTGGGTFRAGAQIHKFYNVDQLDKKSRPLVPLGGNPEKGF